MANKIDEVWFPEKFSFSPAFIMGFFDTLKAKYGNEVVLNYRVFQKAREMWVTSLFALALTKVKETNYWVQAVNREQTPDTYIYNWRPHDKVQGGKTADRINIEVTEWEQHSSTDLVKDVLAKKISKSYPEFFILLVYVKRPNETTNMEKVFQDLKNYKIGLSEINLVSSAAGDTADNHVAMCLYPERFIVNFSLGAELDKNVKESFIRERKFGKGLDNQISGYHTPKFPELSDIIANL